MREPSGCHREREARGDPGATDGITVRILYNLPGYTKKPSLWPLDRHALRARDDNPGIAKQFDHIFTLLMRHPSKTRGKGWLKNHDYSKVMFGKVLTILKYSLEWLSDMRGNSK